MCAGCQRSSRPRASSASRSCRVAAAVAQVPLSTRDDLQRPAALLVEVDGAAPAAVAAQRRRPPAAVRPSAAGPTPRSARPAPAYAAAPTSGRCGRARKRPSRPITGRVGSRSSRHQVTSVRSPNVQTIDQPGALVRARPGGARSTGTSTPKTGVAQRRPDQVGVAGVGRVHDHGDAGRQQLGPRGVHCARSEREASTRRRRPPGPPARPGRPRSGSRRPRASARPPGTRHRGPGRQEPCWAVRRDRSSMVE